MRRTFWIALLLIATLALSACGSAPAATPIPPTATPETAAAPEAEEVEEADETDVEEADVNEADTDEADTAEAPAMAEAGSIPAQCNLRELNVTINGTGASFPNPLYQRWIEEYRTINPGVTINYQSTGSGQGKSDFIAGITDFGGTDALFTEAEHEAAPGTVFIPTVLGAVVATYNLEGTEQLQFSADTLAGIYLGHITSWDDPAIAADNSGVELPSQDITVVYRSDGSGTTYIFTDYLNSVSEEWAERVGYGTAVEWPTGIGGDRNDGVAAAVQQTPGAIGYVELIYALANNLPAPAIQNAAGSYVLPTIQSTTDGAAGFLADMPADLQFSVVNPPEGDNAYPIAGFTWLLLNPEYDDADTAMAIADFICWILVDGDSFARDLRYAPLPDVVKTQAFALLSTVIADGEPIFVMAD